MSQFKKIKKNINKFVLAEHDDETKEQEVVEAPKNFFNNNMQFGSNIRSDILEDLENQNRFVKYYFFAIYNKFCVESDEAPLKTSSSKKIKDMRQKKSKNRRKSIFIFVQNLK